VRTQLTFLRAFSLVSVLLLTGFNSFAEDGLIFDDGLEQEAMITSFSASAASIAAGESTTLSWTTDSAISCTPSGGSGDWNSLDLGVPDGNAQVVILLAGDHTFTLTCQGVVGAPAVAELTVTVSSNALITSFSASPDSILEGGSTTLSWTTVNAESCTATNGTPGWTALPPSTPDGNAHITMSAAGSLTFTLTCQGVVGDPVVANVDVTASKPVAITNLSASPSAILEGASTTLSWAIEDATSCTPSGGAGGWDAVTITSPDGTAQISIPAVGEYSFVLVCQGASGSQAAADVAVTVSPAVHITSFVATPDTILEGGSTTLSWTTENATSCTPLGGAGDWDTMTIAVPDGEAQVVIPTAEVYTFTLTCVGAAGDHTSVDATETVTVEDDPDSCSPGTLPGTVREWKDDFWLEAWPQPVYDNRKAFMKTNDYFALKFNTGNIVDNGKIKTVETTYTDGLRLGSFSECPGDFDVAPECQHRWGISGDIVWATDGKAGACQLKPNTTYYFNVTFTDGVDGSNTSCYSNPCVTSFQVNNRP